MNGLRNRVLMYQSNSFVRKWLGISIRRNQLFTKVMRSIKMWGTHRTLAKISNRLALRFPIFIYFRSKEKDLLLSGCGQFGAASISYFVGKFLGNRFLGCYDIDQEKSTLVQKTYGYKYVVDNFEELLSISGAKRLFIASNHASHTNQAIQAIRKGLMVHIEKPVAVTWQQFAQLLLAMEGKCDQVFVGYNRPFSKAMEITRQNLPSGNGPFTIEHFIVGHLLPSDHWYLDPGEGTRICGNVGHWIDLTIHVLSQRSVPDEWKLVINYSDQDRGDDNFALSMTSSRGDLVNMTFTSRAEPFDGINETTNIQQGQVLLKIDDYISMKLWQNETYKCYKFQPKDVGHKNSIMQMYDESAKYKRPWKEVYLSTLLMLHITDMVCEKITHSKFTFSGLEARLAESNPI